MSRPGYRPSITRPGRREAPAEVLNVDYKDVMDQAVINERLRVFREVRKAIESVSTTEERDRYSYSTKERSGYAVKDDVLKVLTKLENSND